MSSAKEFLKDVIAKYDNSEELEEDVVDNESESNDTSSSTVFDETFRTLMERMPMLVLPLLIKYLVRITLTRILRFR